MCEEIKTIVPKECNFSPFITDASVPTSSTDVSTSKSFRIDNNCIADEEKCLTRNTNSDVSHEKSIKSTDQLEIHAELLEKHHSVNIKEEKNLEKFDNILNGEESSATVEEKSRELATKVPSYENLDNSDLELIKYEQQMNISPEMIDTLKMKLNQYKEHIESFDALKFDVITFDHHLPQTSKKLTNKTSSASSKHLPEANIELSNELMQLKQQLEVRNKQLDKATKLISMMQKGLADRATYIKLLIEDNKRLRKEIKLAVVERKTLMEQMINSEIHDDIDFNNLVEFE